MRVRFGRASASGRAESYIGLPIWIVTLNQLRGRSRTPDPTRFVSRVKGSKLFPLVVVVALLFSELAIAADVIHLKNGETITTEIDAITDNIVSFSQRSAVGSASRTLPADQVEYVEFDFEPGEEEVFARLGSLDLVSLEKWWNFHFGHLHRPRARTAAYGIAFAQKLIEQDSESEKKRALALFDRIIERAWSEKDIALAKQGRLQALIALGELEAARDEAAALASEMEDPELLIEVKFLLAKADFEKLKALEKEHPRWIEDDEVRPERNDLYHNTIDQFLWPHLFHATREGAAARGLAAAAEVYAFGKEQERSQQCFVDLAKLYPDHEKLSQPTDTTNP